VSNFLYFIFSFGATYIGGHPTAHRGRYLILDLDFSEVSAYGDVAASFRDNINHKVATFAKLYKTQLTEQIIVNPSDCLHSLCELFTAVELSKQKVYVIVDEYDSFVNNLLWRIDTSAADMGAQECKVKLTDDALLLLQTFGDILKARCKNAIGRMYFTGVTPLALTDGSSGLNMVKDGSADPIFESTFGFTDKELEQGLQLVCSRGPEFDAHMDNMKSYYDGHRFHSNQTSGVYNTQLCLYYLDSLRRTRQAPNPIMDPNVGAPGEMVTDFIVAALLNVDQLSSIKFVLYHFEADFDSAFVSKKLFEEGSAARALLCLAYSQGYLTFADPNGPHKGCLVCPNVVYQNLLWYPVVRLWERLSPSPEFFSPEVWKGIRVEFDSSLKKAGLELALGSINPATGPRTTYELMDLAISVFEEIE
jgi:Predicted AAA-ATPase